MKDLNYLTEVIIGKAIEVHRELGPGLLESAYQYCLYHELVREGLLVEKEKPLPIRYKDLEIDQGYRMDFLVEKKVVIETKTVDELLDIHAAQVLTYLRFGEYPVGLLINFNVKLLKNGLRRFVM